ncbi:hypothetical protein C8J57DRAFT_1237704 [Mycena rebaudengoi]|nr:hypothetical protein C8J57DRAFT_1237704 [Mycena rebaudengoi]
MTSRYGLARLMRTIRCRICPSIDHPTALCPFPDVPGWLGPTAATITAIEDAGRAAAAKAMEHMRPNIFSSAGGSGSNSGNGRNQGAYKKPRGDGKGKKGNDYKGQGLHYQRRLSGFREQGPESSGAMCASFRAMKRDCKHTCSTPTLKYE